MICLVRLNYLLVLGVLFSAVQVNAVLFSPDEKHFATCSEDGSVRVWSVSSIELVVQFQVLSQVGDCTTACLKLTYSKRLVYWENLLIKT